MIKTKYREIRALNQSLIKLFGEDPVKFYDQYILGKQRIDKTSTAMSIGDLVDFYLLDCEGNEEVFDSRLDERFAIVDNKKTMSQVYTLADELFKVTLKDIVDGEVKTPFSERFSIACKKTQALKKYSGKSEDDMLEDFNKKGLSYFRSLMDSIGKTPVDDFSLSRSRDIVRLLLTDSFTSTIFSKKLLRKLQVEFEYKSIKCKSEIDFVVVDDENKKLYLYDLKTTYDNENFYSSYLKNKYYLQAGFYYVALKSYAAEFYPDYEIEPMQFVVADTSMNNRRPIIYKTTLRDLRHSFVGFTSCGYEYKGLDTLIDDILWAIETNIWNVSREVYENQGVVELGIDYKEINL